ncbi:hypothetical protein SSAG_01649 [Streptomyces sp. Mg1]|nr:hypothetical protein SSAG_01649 [Streptomyces sp. Mg1]
MLRSAGLRAAVGAARLRHGRAGRPRGGRHGALLLQEGADAAYLQRRKPLELQLLGPARPAEGAGPPVRGRQVQGRHLGHRRGRPRDAHDGPGGQRRTRRDAEREVRADRGGRRDGRHQ